MNIFNNLLFDEFANLPAGIGPDAYDITNVTTPDGTPINIDGKHPDGDYTDWQGLTIKQLLPSIVALNGALQAAYAGYKFDPAKGDSYFRTAKGITYGGLIPGNQFKAPYGLQFNIGIQHELRPGTVLSVDYVHNHGVGLPFFLVDFEHRRDASTLNVANARTKINGVLKGSSIDQYIAANPKATIGAFGLANDAIFQGSLRTTRVPASSRAALHDIALFRSRSGDVPELGGGSARTPIILPMHMGKAKPPGRLTVPSSSLDLWTITSRIRKLHSAPTGWTTHIYFPRDTCFKYPAACG